MAKVCVVGGGTAGAEAAREAAMGGAEVTIIEKSERPEPPWKSWPDLINSSATGGNSPERFCCTGTPSATTLVREARSVGQGFVVATDGQKTRFDSIIVATGCGFEPVFFPGIRKAGVLVLDGTVPYEELGRIRGGMGGCVVQGEGVRALQVADRLSGSGRRVHVLTSNWQWEEPSPSVLAVIEDAAKDRGVSIEGGSLSKAVGSGSLEAVVAVGKVISCDALAFVPRRIPRVVPMRASLGRARGLLVDRRLRTTSPDAYAAGGCAELGSEFPTLATLEGDAAMSGRIAGANSVGQRLSINVVRSSEATMFGLRWNRAGFGLASSNARGFSVETVSHRWGATSACSVVYERLNGRVVGIESVERESISAVEMPAIVSSSVSLRTLAYGPLSGSSDISLVSETARLGLRLWSKS